MSRAVRIVWGLAVGVIGCLVTYVVISRIGPVSEVVLGPTLGLILSIIIVSGGIAITIALVFSALSSGKKNSPS